ncbi:hypothetical protein [Frigoriglobus tundricola]|uniref:NolW-like domain-containing protein n=1 Tax=Frigoriglobus tundricola TaxID=2774151 RepID=A0A6M5YVM3_9BACT|nr:hypothetical protein [Frigoriglobus tundricola]QJW96952.1 hypothetical protein FTUN_4512 [Frigoriglobus tundricola]
MSRYARLAVTAVWGLALTAVPTPAQGPNQRADEIRTVPDSPEILAAALNQTVDLDGSKIGDLTLTEGLKALATKHNVTFVIMEEEFKEKKVADIKGAKSRVKQLDTNGLPVAGCLDAWLPGFGATYKIRAEYVEVVPLPAKVEEPNPALKLRRKLAEPGEPKPQKKADPSARVLEVLALEFVPPGDAKVNDTPLFELMQGLSKKYEVSVRINEERFKAEGQPNIKEERPKVTATSFRDLSVHQFLAITLESLNATYLVKSGGIEIVPIGYAASATQSATTDEGGLQRLKEPLVSVIVKEKPLNEVVAQIAEMYDLTVVILPQAADARTGFVTARQLNLPADKALELLALQCDLRVVRRGAAFLLTSKDHANELFGEEMDRERQKIELEKLRDAPPAPPAPPPGAPAPPAPGAPAPKM